MSSLGAPSAVERTRLLLAVPAGTGPQPDGAATRSRLARSLAPVMERVPAGDPAVITVATLRRALMEPERLVRPEAPFRWRPAFVRRSLGLAAVEACAAGRFRAPAQAVGPIADEAVSEWQRTGWRAFHWEPWLAGLARGARAVVLADAVGWASGLWASLDWAVLAPDVRFGGAYDQWTCPGTRTVRLKARSELRVPLAEPVSGSGHGQSHERRTALVSVRSGCPAPGWADELAFVALVAGVRSPSHPVPARVMGLWLDAGIHRCVEIDALSIDRVTDRVVATVGALAEARLSCRPAPGRP